MYNNYFNTPNYYRQQQQIVMVNSIDSAQMYNLPANSSAILLDSNQPIAYIVRTDGAGSKTVGVYDLIAHEDKSPEKIFEERLKKLEEAVYGHIKSNSTEQQTTE